MTTPPQDVVDTPVDRHAWHQYYTEKRLHQQWMQLKLLQNLNIDSVLEIGPYLGYATALLENLGYKVTTLDLFPRRFTKPAVPHIQRNLLELEPNDLPEADAIICCETLEHLPWDRVPKVLGAFHATGARYFVMSVPYEGLQFSLLFHWNPHWFNKRTAIRMLRRFKTFTPDADPLGHKWEIGYRGYSVKALERLLDNAGYRPVQRAFTHGTRTIFFLCERI